MSSSALPTSFIASALSTRTEFEASLLLPSTERLELEAAAARGRPCLPPRAAARLPFRALSEPVPVRDTVPLAVVRAVSQRAPLRRIRAQLHSRRCHGDCPCRGIPRARQRWAQLRLAFRASLAFRRSAAQVECMCCCEIVPGATSLVCVEESKHDLCAGCASGYIESLMGSKTLRQREGGLPCIAIDGVHCEPCLDLRPTMWARETIQPLLHDPTLLQRYIEAVDASPPAEPLPEPTGCIVHKVAELLNVVCPECGHPTDPKPDGCIAMRCEHCHVAFCWMCFAACGRDAHPHAIEAHGEYFVPRSIVKAWHRRWRWRRVSELLERELGDDLGKRMSELQTCEVYLADDRIQLWPFPAQEPSIAVGAQSRNPLLIAATEGNVVAAAAALDGGMDVDTRNDRRMTALHLAAHGGHVELIELLLTRAASPHPQDRDGVTPLDYAERESRPEALLVLLRQRVVMEFAVAESMHLDRLIRFAAIHLHAPLLRALVARAQHVNGVDGDGRCYREG